MQRVKTLASSYTIDYYQLSISYGWKLIMEVAQDIVIVGAGIAGLATSLGLHRLGISSMVLESSNELRTEGSALSTWTNAWHALDALSVAHSLRLQHHQLSGGVVQSMTTSQPVKEYTFDSMAGRNHEVRCVQRKLLLEALGKELPPDTIRYSSKVVSIEESNNFKLVHLVDGTILKTKILIGCDGVNSVVAKWLGFNKPCTTGRSAIRGAAYFENGHGFGHRFLQVLGDGIRNGFIPCDDKTLYWFLTFSPSQQEVELHHDNPLKIKQFVLEKLKDLPDNMKNIIEITALDNLTLSPLRFRPPWELLFKNISKGNVCVAGDAFHPMTPDLGQGGCSALEDAVVLARCIGQALTNKGGEKDEFKRIEIGLKKYSKERKWRGIDLIISSYIAGFMQQGNGKVARFLRDNVFLSSWLSGLFVKKTSFDCGNLVSDS